MSPRLRRLAGWSPLRDLHSPVIYWWTASEADSAHAWQIVYNGMVRPMRKRLRATYFGFRAVRTVPFAAAIR